MKAGSCPEPPPVMTPTLPDTGACFDTITRGFSASRTRSEWALTKPLTVSSTTSSGLLINLCMITPVNDRASEDRVAAIDQKIGAVDHVRAGGGQEYGCGGNLFRIGKAAGGDALAGSLALFAGPCLLAEFG